MTKNEAIQRALRLEREVNECGREIRTLTAANAKLRQALERIAAGQLDTWECKVAREALKEEV